MIKNEEDMKHISVIIPAYNEEKNITNTLQEVAGYLTGKFGKDWEAIVVDDGSSDATYRLAEECIRTLKEANANLRLLKNEKNAGKGSAVRKGMLAAQGDIRLFMDADNATRIEELEKLLPPFSEEADIVIGSRKIKGALIVEKQPFIRRFASRVYHWIVKLLLGTSVSDYNCGFKALKGGVARDLFSIGQANGWEFDAELLFLAKKKGYRVREVPVIWQHKGTSKVQTAHATISSLKGIFSIKKNELEGKYK